MSLGQSSELPFDPQRSPLREMSDIESAIHDLQRVQREPLVDSTTSGATEQQAGTAEPLASDHSTISARTPVAGFQTELPAEAARIDQASASARLPDSVPSPPIHRPRGRLLIGLILLSLFAGAAWITWDGLFRYAAYGVVSAQRTVVRSPFDGVVQSVFVRDGDRVRTGQILATVACPALENRIERTREARRLAEAELDAAIVRLTRQARLRKRDSLDDAAEYFELASRLRQHQANAQHLERRLERAARAHDLKAVSQDLLDEIQARASGESGLTEILQHAVASLEERSRMAAHSVELDLRELEPTLVAIDNLQQELQRLTRQLAHTRIRAPVDGIVASRPFAPGMRIAVDEAVVELVDADSIEPVVYLPQADAAALRPGDRMSVRLLSRRDTLSCRVQRIGDELASPPDSIARFYARSEPVLPVILRPLDDCRLRPGSVLQVPWTVLAGWLD